MKDVANAMNIESLFDRDDIKVRIYEIDNSFMGIKEQEHSYVTAELLLLNNKTENQLSLILESVQKILVKYFSNKSCKSSITCRITLIGPKFYQRTVNY
jgi:5-carboxymethyl-2-hydroxymuconate isomerase